MMPNDSLTSEAPSTAGPTLQAQASEAYAEARRALAAWVRSLGAPIKRPRDLQLATQLDYKLCWQVVTVINSEVAEGAPHVPGPVSLKRMLAESKRQRLAEAVVVGLRQGLERFHDAAKSHADTRAGFGSMIAALTSRDVIDVQPRRNAYRAESEIWGTQLDTYHMLCVFTGRPTRGTYSGLSCSTQVGLRRLRPTANRRIWGFHRDPAAGAPQVDPAAQAIDAAAFREYGAPLLPEFCSNPMPRFRVVSGDDGWSFTELNVEGIGRKTAVDLAFGSRVASEPLMAGLETPHAAAATALFFMPAAMFVMDVLLHRPTFGRPEPKLMIHANGQGIHQLSTARRATPLPIDASVVRLPVEDEALYDPEVPKAPEIARRLLDTAGMPPSEFDAYRVKVPYPILHSVIRMYFEVGS
jgi:hypothetical protein